MKSIFTILLALSSSLCYAGGEWIPVQPRVVIEERIVTTTVNVAPPRPEVVYQMVPHVVMEPVFVETRRIFTTQQTIRIVPITHWVLEPRIVWRQ